MRKSLQNILATTLFFVDEFLGMAGTPSQPVLLYGSWVYV
jgi:hypothetical protein